MSFLTLAGFRARFPEFATTPGDALVQSALDDAEEEIDEDVWGDLTAKGHGLLAAHLLTTRGAPGREVPKDGTTSYERHYDRLVRRVGGAYRLVLD